MGVVYQRTLNRNSKGSPMTSFVELRARLGTLYAVAARISASSEARFGEVWRTTLRDGEICRWLNWRVPARANMSGI